MDDKQKLLNYFFYLAPVWFLLETFLWPGFRAGVVTGGNPWGNALFYSAEAGLGAAIWFKLPYADTSALIENVIYLIFCMKFIMFTPLDIAMSLDNDMPRTTEMINNYRASLPGIIYSMAHVVFRIKKSISMN
ncbi:MAG: hypothetical protein A2270_01275 [Elusimicrobia bacterium RIFOXYA12_FULL_51_18]|nr:MAG: hypothetical protein A2270_01275 [Elusimicrobia bacterium RIFOXYA12_FULL_51_18]OGS30037.1 MAG: hypothetical protein A2218_12870 [Elusimicrobia bacterium RIFOXYA2_FULL_53_38]